MVPWKPQDPYYDSRDGRLRGRSIYQGDGCGALAWDLAAGGIDEVTIYIAVAERARKALGLLEEARGESPAAHLAETEAWWADWIGRARLPKHATAGPPLGPALGPLGINIMNVIKAINDKTKDFEGMKVPVKVIVDTATKDFEITVGTPPTSALIKGELGSEKGSQRLP